MVQDQFYPLFSPRSNRIEKSPLRVMEIPCTGPAINLFIGRICKYPSRNITSPPPPRKSRANIFRLPYVLRIYFAPSRSASRAREKKQETCVYVYRCRGCILRDTRRRCKARAAKMAVRKTYYWGLGRDEGSTLPMEYEKCFARNEIFGIFRFDGSPS